MRQQTVNGLGPGMRVSSPRGEGTIQRRGTYFGWIIRYDDGRELGEFSSDLRPEGGTCQFPRGGGDCHGRSSVEDVRRMEVTV